MRPFLDDTILKASDPDVVLVIDEAAMQPQRQCLRAAVRESRGIAPAVDDVALRVVPVQDIAFGANIVTESSISFDLRVHQDGPAAQSVSDTAALTSTRNRR